MTQCHAIFDQKLINVTNHQITKNGGFRWHENKKDQKAYNNSFCKTDNLDFQKMSFLPQKKKQRFFFYKILKKSKNLKLSKNVQYVAEPGLGIWHAKFSLTSTFGKHIAQKPYPWMTSFLLLSILSISRHRTKIKMTFLEDWDKIGSEPYMFIRKKSIRKFDLMLPGVDPTLLFRRLALSQIAN